MARGGIVGAIPARYASTRLPGKPLLPIAGRPMIEHVVRRVESVSALDRAVVLTDDERIVDAVREFGGDVEMTPEDCVSGTDRIAWAARRWDCDGVINIQGDEPLIDVDGVARLAELLGEDPSVEMATLAAPFADGTAADTPLAERHADPNAVKVVTALDGRALYFSRAPIPFPRDGATNASVAPRLHVGVYAYRRDILLRLAELAPTGLERTESLEQLRALEHGITIHVLDLDHPAAPGVDTPDDLARVETLLRHRGAIPDPRS
ncbi:MAG: 3-deoxy-manno-octulosonate cytidylyltransferase [Acidobacteriota bacterium]